MRMMKMSLTTELAEPRFWHRDGSAVNGKESKDAGREVSGGGVSAGVERVDRERIQTNCRAFAGRRSVSVDGFFQSGQALRELSVRTHLTLRRRPGYRRTLRARRQHSERAADARGGDVLIAYVDVKQDALLANDFDRKLSLSRIGLDPSPVQWYTSIYIVATIRAQSANGATVGEIFVDAGELGVRFDRGISIESRFGLRANTR